MRVRVEVLHTIMQIACVQIEDEDEDRPELSRDLIQWLQVLVHNLLR